MGLTQKYKQQQQQVRVQTNEELYNAGMYFSDTPLTNGQSRVMINYDIDSLTGKLTPRRGLQSLGCITPDVEAKEQLTNAIGENVVLASKVCTQTDPENERHTIQKLQSVLYNTDTTRLLISTSEVDATDIEFTAPAVTYEKFDETGYYAAGASTPYILKKPGVYNKACATNMYFKKPVGTFAFGDSYYTFIEDKSTAQKLITLPYQDIPNMSTLLSKNTNTELNAHNINRWDVVQIDTPERLSKDYLRPHPFSETKLYGEYIWEDAAGNTYYSQVNTKTHYILNTTNNTWEKIMWYLKDSQGNLREFYFNGAYIWHVEETVYYKGNFQDNPQGISAVLRNGVWEECSIPGVPYDNYIGQWVFEYNNEVYLIPPSSNTFYKFNKLDTRWEQTESSNISLFTPDLWQDTAGALYYNAYKLQTNANHNWVWQAVTFTHTPSDFLGQHIWKTANAVYFSKGSLHRILQGTDWVSTDFHKDVYENNPDFLYFQGKDAWHKDGIYYVNNWNYSYAFTDTIKTMVRSGATMQATDASLKDLIDRAQTYYKVSALKLAYTRPGKDIKKISDISLLNPNLIKSKLADTTYYPCKIIPQKLNPTEAASWGYNMLLDDPYDFVCEETAYNNFTITGVLPYDKDNKPIITPRKNQTVTLKCFYRGPKKYVSDANNLRAYATTKKQITVTESYTALSTAVIENTTRYALASTPTEFNVYYGYVRPDSLSGVAQMYYQLNEDAVVIPVKESDLAKTTKTEVITRDPSTKSEISLTGAKIGDWWYVTSENKYYMAIPKTTFSELELDSGSDTKPAVSVMLALQKTGTENDIRVAWEMRSQGAAGWTTLSDRTFKISDYIAQHNNVLAPFMCTTTLPDNEVIVKCTIYDPLDTAENEPLVLSTNTIGLSLVSDEIDNALNLTADNFELGKCTGMCEWERRLVLWGVPNALDTIFISDVDNPGFFPYPNNIDTFVDPIMAVHNYGDELLVLTTTALYRLIWDVDGLGWTHRLVQQNLHVTEADIPFTKVIKNMFFFKSGDYFYMMVPKVTSASSVRGEVTIAPISKPIEKLLDNFHEEVYNLIKVMVDKDNLQDFTDKLVNYFVYNDSSKIVVNYVYSLDEVGYRPPYLYVQLIYDTELRAWTMKAFEAPQMLYASHQDAIQQDRFLSLTDKDGADQVVIQYYKFGGDVDNKGKQDTAVKKYNEDGTPVYSEKLIKNYQYLDTGNREINTELKKRFREFQIKIKNKSLNSLSFYNAFLIDGSLRKDLQHYNPVAISDPATGEVIIVVEKVLDDNFEHMMFTPMYKTTRIERVLVPQRMLQDDGELMPTTLAEENTDADAWVLNQSAFPGRSLYKIRMPISGKGYAPRAIILSTNETDYDILGHTWVYRTMNGR